MPIHPKKQPHHPAGLLLKCTIQFLQVHQGAGLGTAIHYVLIHDHPTLPVGHQG